MVPPFPGHNAISGTQYLIDGSRVSTPGVANPASFIRKIPAFLNQVKAETAKVVWPTGRETAMTTVMVIIMTTLLAIFFFGIDRLFGWVVRSLLTLAV